MSCLRGFRLRALIGRLRSMRIYGQHYVEVHSTDICQPFQHYLCTLICKNPLELLYSGVGLLQLKYGWGLGMNYLVVGLMTFYQQIGPKGRDVCSTCRTHESARMKSLSEVLHRRRRSEYCIAQQTLCHVRFKIPLPVTDADVSLPYLMRWQRRGHQRCAPNYNNQLVEKQK